MTPVTLRPTPSDFYVREVQIFMYVELKEATREGLQRKSGLPHEPASGWPRAALR